MRTKTIELYKYDELNDEAKAKARDGYCRALADDELYRESVYDMAAVSARVNAVSDELEQVARDFMDWIYKRLESEWEYQNSDETVAENIRANEYEFTADGRRED